jgi:putative membrane protein
VLQAMAASAQDDASKTFFTQTIEGNYAVMQMGELAIKNGQSGGVKTFGETLKNEHNEANKKAIEVAKSLGVTPPNGPNAKQKADHDKMSMITGPEFDNVFAQHMVTDHQKHIAEYTEAAKKQDAAGRYATGALPALQRHLQTAQGLQKDAATTGGR